jgi:cell division protein FtsB
MRMRRRFSESFKVLVVPVVCCAVTAYFGYSGIVGPRGIIAWNRTEAELAVKQRELAQVQSERKALEHRISLLNAKALDPDMLDEVARGVLSQGRPGEVAVPRRSHD